MTQPRTAQLNPDYRKTYKYGDNAVICIRCQKEIKTKNYRMVNLANNGWEVIHPADSHMVTDSMDWHPIGNDCARIESY